VGGLGFHEIKINLEYALSAKVRIGIYQRGRIKMLGIVQIGKNDLCDVCAKRISMDDASPEDTLCSKHEELYNLLAEHGDGRWYQ